MLIVRSGVPRVVGTLDVEFEVEVVGLYMEGSVNERDISDVFSGWRGLFLFCWKLARWNSVGWYVDRDEGVAFGVEYVEFTLSELGDKSASSRSAGGAVLRRLSSEGVDVARC